MTIVWSIHTKFHLDPERMKGYKYATIKLVNFGNITAT